MAKSPLFAKLAVFICALGVCANAYAWSEIMCAGDIPPEGLVVTATGTAPSCTGACRARKVQPVFGEIMKICADQPIPKGYVLDGITATPACRCLGGEENAYIIKREPLNYGYGYDETLVPNQNQTSLGNQAPPGAPNYPYPYPYPNQGQNQAPLPGSSQYPSGAPGFAGGNNPAAPGMMGGPYPPSYPLPYEQEPMRIGE